MFHYRIEQYFSRSSKEIFQFFSDEKNLDKMTPPWYQITILGKNTERTQKGTLLDYKFVIKGLPISWRSRIVENQPYRRFTYIQEIGPYASFKHEHLFRKKGPGCVMTDHVVYELRGGLIGQWLMGPWIQKNLDDIFQYRKKKAIGLFGKVRKLS